MNIGIVGLGVVGGAVRHGLERLGHKVCYHDTAMNTHLRNVLDTEICYICVPTPSDENGDCDTSVVEGVVRDLVHHDYKGIIAIKSTVIPGTTKRLQMKYDCERICFVPEFLRERCALADFVENHDVCVIGAQNDAIFEKIKKSHGKYPQSIVQLAPTEAELVKYFNNTFFAMLITYANSFYEICKALDSDYDAVKEAITKRKFISDYYLDCSENLRGFGGVCLPKDTKAFNRLIQKLDLDIDLFETILKENSKYKTTVYEGMRNE
tara:strand:+ start:885 stop:1682 length:798 start_codon:yes stop_codon:yes gene_type:complete